MKTRVVNIVGCKVVQIGKGNKVMKAGGIHGDKMEVPHDMDKHMDLDSSNRYVKKPQQAQLSHCTYMDMIHIDINVYSRRQKHCNDRFRLIFKTH